MITPDEWWHHVGRCIPCLVGMSFVGKLDGFAVLRACFVTSHVVKTVSLNQIVHIFSV